MTNIIITRSFLVYLILLQVLDGLLTYWGVVYTGYGPQIEGNPLLQYLIIQFGPGIALFSVKCFAIVLLLVWYKHFKKTNSYFCKISCLILSIIYSIVVVLWLYIFIKYYVSIWV